MPRCCSYDNSWEIPLGHSSSSLLDHLICCCCLVYWRWGTALSYKPCMIDNLVSIIPVVPTRGLSWSPFCFGGLRSHLRVSPFAYLCSPVEASLPFTSSHSCRWLVVFWNAHWFSRCEKFCHFLSEFELFFAEGYRFSLEATVWCSCHPTMEWVMGFETPCLLSFAFVGSLMTWIPKPCSVL